MLIEFENGILKLENIQNDELSSMCFTPHERAVIKRITEWTSNEPYFTFNTSGSTGPPKKIQISRRKMEYSCHATLNYLDPDAHFKTSLLCLNPEMIGGAMVIFRALVANMNLRILLPSSHPFGILKPHEKYDLVSMAPIQIKHVDKHILDHFHTVLVGGAALGHFQNKSSAQVFVTFGMTETASHIALRRASEDVYECVGDAKILKSEDKRLRITGTITDYQTLITNDLIEPISETKFRWIGRYDLIINSGGIKINPEVVESVLSPTMQNNFIASSLPDDQLGNRLILIIEGKGEKHNPNYARLKKYEIPKELHYLDQFIYTPSGKVNRIQTKNKLLQKLGM